LGKPLFGHNSLIGLGGINKDKSVFGLIQEDIVVCFYYKISKYLT